MIPTRVLRLFRESFWIVLGKGLIVLASLVGVRLLTGLLPPAVYGELALGMTIATLIGQIFMGPLSAGVTRFYSPASEKNDLNNYITAVCQLIFVTTASILLLTVLVGLGLLGLGWKNWAFLMFTTTTFAIFSGYDSLLSGLQNAARQRIIVTFHGAVGAWGRNLIAVVMVIFIGAKSSSVMLGYALASIPVIISQLFFFKFRLANRFEDERHEINSQCWQQQIWRYSWPFITWGVFSGLQMSSDRWALELFATTQEVGFYAVIFQLGYYPMSIATNIMMELLAPIFYQRAGDGQDIKRNIEVNKLGWHLTKLCLGLTFLGCIVGLLFHKQIFAIFVHQDYASISYYFPLVLLASGLFASGQTLALNLMSLNQSQAMIAVKVGTCTIGIVLNYVGAYFRGLQGVIFASVLFSCIYFFWMSVLSQKQMNKIRLL